MVWRIRRQVCLAVAVALALFVSRLGEVQEAQQPIPAQSEPPLVAAAQPLRQPKSKVCLELLAAPQAACRHEFPVWPAIQQAAVPCTSARSAASDDVGAAWLCSSLLDSLHLDPSARATVALQLQLLRTRVNVALKDAASPVPGAHCQLQAHVESTDASVEAWLPHLSVAEQSLREAYNLSIVAVPPAGAAHITIHSPTVLGLRHALRTLADLVSAASISVSSSKGDNGGVALPAVVIEDRPRFGYRGLILDTSHHFLTVGGLLNTVALLGRLKYNVLHWHLTDTQSFQLEVPSHPELAHASTEPSERYSLDDLRTVVAAARLEGVSVLLEIETPGHASSWAHSHPELSVVGAQSTAQYCQIMTRTHFVPAEFDCQCVCVALSRGKHETPPCCVAGPTDGVAAHVSPSGESYTKCPAGKGNLDPTNEARLGTHLRLLCLCYLLRWTSVCVCVCVYVDSCTTDCSSRALEDLSLICVVLLELLSLSLSLSLSLCRALSLSLSQELYTVLGAVLADLDEDLLPLAAVHMGGEEVFMHALLQFYR